MIAASATAPAMLSFVPGNRDGLDAHHLGTIAGLTVGRPSVEELTHGEKPCAG